MGEVFVDGDLVGTVSEVRVVSGPPGATEVFGLPVHVPRTISCTGKIRWPSWRGFLAPGVPVESVVFQRDRGGLIDEGWLAARAVLGLGWFVEKAGA